VRARGRGDCTTGLIRPPAPSRDEATDAALARAAAAVARLDQTLAGHPLLPAVLYRARLDAVSAGGGGGHRSGAAPAVERLLCA
jgi:hypothetical protein